MRFACLLLSCILLIGALLSSAQKTNRIIVKLKPAVNVAQLISTHPGVKFERASTLPRVFVFSVENINSADEEVNKFISDPYVAWATIDEVREYEPDLLPTDPSVLAGQQWFHLFINSTHAWRSGFSGQGQLVQVIDTPVFPSDIDLRNQLDPASSYGGTVTEQPEAVDHGTVCTNLIVAEANDFCGAGVAFSAKAAIFPFIANRDGDFSDLAFAEAYALAFSVSSNSYGRAMCLADRGCNIDHRGMIPAIHEAIELAQDRNNTVFVFTAGNDGVFGGSPNFRDFGATPRVIIVGATRFDGTRASYSNVGPANWIVAPAGDHGEAHTWTSTVVGGQQQCGWVGVGTSFAAPMVSGAAAILRSAYPSLTWRDIKLILAYSANIIDAAHESWIRNGAGRLFSNAYGFGQLNIGNAVELATSWKPIGPLQIRTFQSNAIVAMPPTHPVTTSTVEVPHGIISKVESVQMTLSLNVAQRGDYQIELISPAGTHCIIFPFRRDTNRGYFNYLTTANCFLDEDPAGTWTLRIERSNQSAIVDQNFLDALYSFSVIVWGQASPSQVHLLTPTTATRLSSFTVTEGDTFQQLTLFNNYPATLGLFWKDAFGLFGEVFTPQGKQTTGTQRLNPSNSDHPTISVFNGGDHVLTYLTTIGGSTVMQAEVRNIDFVPLTPLTTLPFTDVNSNFVSAEAIEDSFILSYRSSATSLSKLALLRVNFGSRDTTPLCVPFSNFTTDASDDDPANENNCTEIIYRRDGEITLMTKAEIMTQAPIALQGIGMNLVLGTWSDGQSITAALIRSDLTMNITKLQAPPTSKVRAAATPEDVFIAFGHQQGVLVERYDMDMNLHESFAFSSNEPVGAVDIAYTHVEGLSLIVATSHNISLTTFLRSYDRSFVQTNQATIASMLSINVPVLDIDQSVMSNGDLAVTFSTIQEIHVQVFDSTIFGSVLLEPIIQQPTIAPAFVDTPTINVAPMIEQTPTKDSPYKILDDVENQFPSWAIALIVIAGLTISVLVIVFVLRDRKRKRSHGRVVGQQDPDLIAYTKMSV